MQELLSIIQGFSPIAAIALSLVIIYQLVQKDKKIENISDNHLSCLPDMTKTLERLESKSDKQIELLIKIENNLK